MVALLGGEGLLHPAIIVHIVQYSESPVNEINEFGARDWSLTKGRRKYRVWWLNVGMVAKGIDQRHVAKGRRLGASGGEASVRSVHGRVVDGVFTTKGRFTVYDQTSVTETRQCFYPRLNGHNVSITGRV